MGSGSPLTNFYYRFIPMQLDQDLTNFFLEKDGQKEAWLDSLEAVIALP